MRNLLILCLLSIGFSATGQQNNPDVIVLQNGLNMQVKVSMQDSDFVRFSQVNSDGSQSFFELPRKEVKDIFLNTDVKDLMLDMPLPEELNPQSNEAEKNCDLVITHHGDTIRCTLISKDNSNFYGTIWDNEKNKAEPYSIEAKNVRKISLANPKNLLNRTSSAREQIRSMPELYRISAARHLRNARYYHFSGYAVLLIGTGAALLSSAAALPVIGIVTGVGFIVFDLLTWSAINKAGLLLFEIEQKFHQQGI